MSNEFEDAVATWVSEGVNEHDATTLVRVGIKPGMLSCPGEDALGFASAADHQDLDADYVAFLLKQARGNPDEAWELWASDEEDDDEDEGDAD